MLLAVVSILQLSSDTLHIRTIATPPEPEAIPRTARYGSPQIRLQTNQGSALVWFLRSADTFFVAAAIKDSTRYWGDDFVLSIDTRGDGGESPHHDDFQLYFRRALDSSVVFRGRNGRWEPPQGDPDWRLGSQRSGGGWEISTRDEPNGWTLLLRLDPAWFRGENERLARLAIRVFDDDPQGWFAWPLPPATPQASSVERTPDMWAAVKWERGSR